MQLHLSTFSEIEAYLGRSNGIVIPTGSTEQHGPSGLIGTDTICPEYIASEFASGRDVLVGPAIPFGAAQFNLGFPGTVSVRPTTLIALITDYVQSLSRAGFRKFYFLNGHGGNIAPLKAAFQELYADRSLDPAAVAPEIRCRLRSWWDLPSVDVLRREMFGEAEGMHATPSEISVTRFAHPGLATGESGPFEPETPAFFRDHAQDDHPDAHAHRRRFPTGKVGSDPSLASADRGEALVAAAVADLVDDYSAFLAET